MAIFTGAGVALITPMKEDLSVNYDKLKELVDFHVENQTDAIVICGTTGEAATLSHEEHLEVIKACVDFTKKRIPVIAGTGSNCTKTAVYLSKEAEKRGADGLLLSTPYYNKATQNGLKAHFTEVAKAVDLPMLLYNIPGRTGVNMAAETSASLINEVDTIVGIKEASDNIALAEKIMYLTNGEADLYSGCDDLILPLMAVGAKGVISVLSHVAPKETHDIVAEFLKGNVEESRRLQYKYLDVIGKLFCEVNPIPVKAALNLMGMEVGGLRMPLTQMEPENKKALKEALNKAGIATV